MDNRHRHRGFPALNRLMTVDTQCFRLFLYFNLFDGVVALLDFNKTGRISSLNNCAQESFRHVLSDAVSWVSTPNKDCWGWVFL